MQLGVRGKGPIFLEDSMILSLWEYSPQRCGKVESKEAQTNQRFVGPTWATGYHSLPLISHKVALDNQERMKDIAIAHRMRFHGNVSTFVSRTRDGITSPYGKADGAMPSVRLRR